MGQSREQCSRGVKRWWWQTAETDPPWGTQSRVSGRWPTWEGSEETHFHGACQPLCTTLLLGVPRDWSLESLLLPLGRWGERWEKKTLIPQSTLNSCFPGMISILLSGSPSMTYYASGSVSASYHLELISLGECFLSAPNNSLKPNTGNQTLGIIVVQKWSPTDNAVN